MAGTYHPPLEEYLEIIYALEEEGVPVIQARLAERLGHSAPSVSETVRRLRDEGWVDIDRRSVTFTNRGRARAESVVRRHRLAERLLTDVIGLPWEDAHREAGRWEHVISDAVEERLVDLLGHPTTCPHGNPIPMAHAGGEGSGESGGEGSGGVAARIAAQVAVGEVAPGETVRIERVTEAVEADGEAMQYLACHGAVPGKAAVVASRAPDGTVILDVAGTAVALGARLATQVFVTRSPS